MNGQNNINNCKINTKYVKIAGNEKNEEVTTYEGRNRVVE